MRGGQLLFAGGVTKVLVQAKSGPTMGRWDGMAAMIYPTPTGILQMEREPAYREASRYCNEGLARTAIIAAEPY